MNRTKHRQDARLMNRQLRCPCWILAGLFLLEGAGCENNATPTVEDAPTQQSPAQQEPRDTAAFLKEEFDLSELPAEDGGGLLVSTYFAPCREQYLPLLRDVNGLRWFIMLDGNPYSPQGWEQIGQIADLEKLQCQSSPLTDDHIASLFNASSLRDLQLFADLRGKHLISDRGLEVLRGMLDLRRLVLHSSRINDRACELIGNCKQLRSLVLSGPISDSGIEALGELPELRELVLQGEFTDLGLSSLQRYNRLQRLGLISENIDGSGLAYLSELKELAELRFSGSPQSTLAALKQWPALTTLNLCDSSARDAQLESVRDVPHLQFLSVQGTAISDAGLQFVGNMRNLKELDLLATAITSRGLLHLQSLHRLERLRLGNSLRSNLISGDALRSLVPCERLTELDMRYVNSEDLDLLQLAEIQPLRRVNFVLSNDEVARQWKELRAARLDITKVGEIIFKTHRVGRLDPHPNPIPDG